jgi:uncharacterized protein YndB with AHSA1/START domain
MTELVTHLFEIYIQAPPEKIWQALTDGAMTQQYYFGTKVVSDWQQGSSYRYQMPDGSSMLDGEVLEIDPPRRLVTTFKPGWEGSDQDPVSTVTFEIEPMGEVSKLRLIHEGLTSESPLTSGVRDGWSQILSSLKTLLETGKPLQLSPPE